MDDMSSDQIVFVSWLIELEAQLSLGVGPRLDGDLFGHRLVLSRLSDKRWWRPYVPGQFERQRTARRQRVGSPSFYLTLCYAASKAAASAAIEVVWDEATQRRQNTIRGCSLNGAACA